MARKKSEEEPCGNWMDTYGDMVTLLLTFFVMLFSMSSVNEEKFAVLVRAFTSDNPNTANIILDQAGVNENEMNFPINRSDQPATDATLANATLEEMAGLVPQDFNDLYEYLKAYVEKSRMEGSVEVSKPTDGCVFIRFQDSIFFNSDSSTLKKESEPLLEFLGNCLKSVENQVMTININGHTADPKIENYQISDWRLSSERASNVAIFFEENKKIDPKKLLPIGYGKNFPVASNDTPEGRQRNRRVDMMIISTSSSMSDEEILRSILAGTFDTDAYPEQGGLAEVLIPPSSVGDAKEKSAQGSPSEPESSPAALPPSNP